MKSVNTKLSDNDYEEIVKSGISHYKFLQLAVSEKLYKNSQKKDFENLMYDVVEALNSRIEGFEKELQTSNKIAREKLAIIADALNKRS